MGIELKLKNSGYKRKIIYNILVVIEKLLSLQKKL